MAVFPHIFTFQCGAVPCCPTTLFQWTILGTCRYCLELSAFVSTCSPPTLRSGLLSRNNGSVRRRFTFQLFSGAAGRELKQMEQIHSHIASMTNCPVQPRTEFKNLLLSYKPNQISMLPGCTATCGPLSGWRPSLYLSVD